MKRVVGRVRKQRRRIYFGCEGESEQSYGKLLGMIADDAGLFLHFDTDLLRPGGGDPLALLQLAERRLEEKERRHGRFDYRAVLLDRDKIGICHERDALIEPLAARNKIHLLWQTPCHEAFVLRHFDGFGTTQPYSSTLAYEQLRRIWPEYKKNIPAVELAARIDLAAVLRAASVLQEFADFLSEIGFRIAR